MASRRIFSLFFIVAFVLSTVVPALFDPGSGFAAQAKKGRKSVRMPEEAGEGAAPVRGKKGAPAATSQKDGPSDTSPGQINARSAILIEVSTGTVLFEQNADEPIEPASFTKILTLYLVQDALKEGRVKLTDEIYISTEAWRTGGSKMFVGDGTRVPLEDLLKGIAVVSGNDACVAVAEHLYGSVDAFVDAMNRKAHELGMNQSRFMNPHGLPAEGQITTARDMGTLDLSYLQHYPDTLAKYHSLREYTYNNISQYNRNHLLLKDPSVDGLKTGYVGAAGYHLSATSQRDGMRLLAIVMGAATPGIREREASKLLNYGFRHFSLVQPFQPGAPVTKVKVWKGERDELSLFASDVPSFLVPQAQKKQLRWEVKTQDEVVAPVTVGQKFGELTFYLADEPKRTVSLVSQEDIPLGGIFKRMWQSILQFRKIDWRWFAGIGGGLVFLFLLSIVVAKTRARRRSSF